MPLTFPTDLSTYLPVPAWYLPLVLVPTRGGGYLGGLQNRYWEEDNGKSGQFYCTHLHPQQHYLLVSIPQQLLLLFLLWWWWWWWYNVFLWVFIDFYTTRILFTQFHSRHKSIERESPDLSVMITNENEKVAQAPPPPFQVSHPSSSSPHPPLSWSRYVCSIVNPLAIMLGKVPANRS